MESDDTTRTFATLRVLAKTLDATEITRKLCISPTEAKNVGDPRGKSKKWSHSYWEFTSQGQIYSTDLNDHLSWLVNVIESSADELRNLKHQGATVDIFCFWETSSRQKVILLTSETLRILGRLDLSLGIDIYFAF